MSKRVIVCGSRGWRDRSLISTVLASLPEDTIVVIGYDAKRKTPAGADRIAFLEAQRLNLRIDPHPANWNKYKKAAGHIRNEEMAASGVDLCIAFWDGNSPGTAVMMGIARRYDILVLKFLEKEA